MTVCYGYDGSFEGFACALSRALTDGVEHARFRTDGDEEQRGLFQDQAVEVATERGIAVAFRERFVVRTSTEAFTRLRLAFHSQQPGVEQLLWEYLRLGVREGSRLTCLLADRRVNGVERLAHKVSREVHRYLGFVRFRELEQGFLYAAIEPEADILRFLAPHFVQRVSDRPWMIHDLRRSRAALYDLAGWRLVGGIELARTPDYSPAEGEFSRLWQRYFHRLSIEERRNPELQRRLVPLRCRTHLVEFEDS